MPQNYVKKIIIELTGGLLFFNKKAVSA